MTVFKEDGSVSGLTSAGLRGRDGDPERPSCKYPASMYSDRLAENESGLNIFLNHVNNEYKEWPL